EAYALDRGLRWRTDPTNEDHGPSRNRLRGVVIPEIERYVAPHARRNLVALASLAAESESGWRAVVAEVRDQLVRSEGAAYLVAREKLRAYHPAIGTRIVREVLERFGSVP